MVKALEIMSKELEIFNLRVMKGQWQDFSFKYVMLKRALTNIFREQ